MPNARTFYRVLSFIAGLALVGLEAAPASAALISVLQQLSPLPVTYAQNPDASIIPHDNEALVGSPTGNVTALLQAVDLLSGTSGCEASDFAGFAAGRIALIETGACFSWIKVVNAQSAGAVGVLIFDEQTPSTSGATLGGVVTAIPSVFTTEEIGEELAALVQSGPVTVHLAVIQVPDVAVPEPVTLALFGAGLVGFGVLRRRERS